jgi:hypothetical protein
VASEVRPRLVGALPFLGAVVAAAGVAALLVMLNWTSITDASHLVHDFPADAWLMQHQAAALREGIIAPLTLTADSAAFYPVFAFYGGTLFLVGGVITLLVGSADAAETTMTILALAAAYGGWFWLARMAGVRSWPAHAPAIIYVTAPYVLTNINVRQDFAELVAGAVVPLMVASALSVMRADRLRAGPAAALAASVVVFGGSHNLTLLWGTTILVIAAPAVAIGVPQVRRQVSTRGVLRVLTVVVPAMSVNAWYLLPGLAYHTDTVIANRIDEWKALLKTSHPELGAEYLFALGRPSAFAGSGLTITLPVLAIGWVIIAAVVCRAQWQTTWARMLAILVLLTVAVFVVMTHPRWILALPDPWQMIQYSYRLVTFVLFGICGAIIAALVLVDRSGRRWLIWLLVPVMVFSVIGAAIQRHEAPRGAAPMSADIDSYGSFNIGDYADGRLRELPPDQNRQILIATRASVKEGRLVSDLRAAPREVIYTNLMVSPRLVDIEGARVIGRWPGPPAGVEWQSRWALVLQVADDAKAGKARIVVQEARSLPIVAGRIVSLLGVLGLVAIGVAILAGTVRRRRAGPRVT